MTNLAYKLGQIRGMFSMLVNIVDNVNIGNEEVRDTIFKLMDKANNVYADLDLTEEYRVDLLRDIASSMLDLLEELISDINYWIKQD